MIEETLTNEVKQNCTMISKTTNYNNVAEKFLG